MIGKKYSKDNDPEIPKDRIIDALRAGNKLSAAMATDIANMKIGIHQHKRAMGDSHQQVEDVIVDQATRVMNHLTEESKRQNKEALEEYFKTPNFFVDLLNKVVEAVEQNSRKVEQNSSCLLYTSDAADEP